MKNLYPIRLVAIILVVLILSVSCKPKVGAPTVKSALVKPDLMAIPDFVKATADGYGLAEDGGLIYNPISAEAEKVGTLNMYDGKPTTTVNVNQAGAFDAEFTMPTELVPYSSVPIDYKITKKGNIDFPLSIVATAFEEKGRGTGDMYDLAVPGSVSIDFNYLGSVTGTINEQGRHIMKADNTDNPAAAYPHYETTELSESGTVKSGDLVWLKFSYTNTGDTILDVEGTGGFIIEPKLFKKQVDGKYIQVGKLFNQFVRELTYVYPGETREFWVNFMADSGGEQNLTPENLGLGSGEYQVRFESFYRTEYDYQPYTTMWAGYPLQTSTFDFSVADTAKDTKAKNVRVISSGGKRTPNKASWLHYFEEFMTTYEQFAADSGTDVIEGRIWLQPASFTEQVVLKVIHNDPKTISLVSVPVTINSDSIKVNYNENNLNVVRGEDGLAWPAVHSHLMTDMRVNVDISPYPEETIIKDLLTMKESGVNVLSNQGWFYLYDNTIGTQNGVNLVSGTANRKSNVKGDALKYTLDISRRMGFDFDAMGTFYYGSAQMGNIAQWITNTSHNFSMASNIEGDKADKNIPKAIVAGFDYQRARWGDIYWRDAANNTNYAIEDVRGYLRYEMNGRLGMGNKEKDAFREWLEKKYSNIAALNQAWGTAYTKFSEIDPEKGQPHESVLGFIELYNYTNAKTGFNEWSPAVIDLDIFRTELKVTNYEETAALLRENDPNAMLQIRTEGNNMPVPGLDPSTTNAHYRNLIYNSMRNATLGELIAPSKAVRSYMDHIVLPLTPSEITEVVGNSVKSGLIPMMTPQFNNMRDYVINEKYGRDFKNEYNLETSQKAALVKSLTGLFPWWKATYEAGGMPGVLWQDLACDGVVTETQQKEMKFFKEKVEKMMSDPEIQKKAKMDKLPYPVEKGNYSYEIGFLDEMIEKVKGAK